MSGEILLARPLLSECETDLTALITEVQAALPVPIQGVISDGQHSICNAVASALPGVPHQLCHFHYLREAAKPVYEADRHAKKELKKHVRGVRPIERAIEKRNDDETTIIRNYCLAVRSALTDDGHPPHSATGQDCFLATICPISLGPTTTLNTHLAQCVITNNAPLDGNRHLLAWSYEVQ